MRVVRLWSAAALQKKTRVRAGQSGAKTQQTEDSCQEPQW
jgi:hypothetical protein